MPGKGLRIGITIGLRSPDESLWINGIKQNAVYLAEALRHVTAVASVQLVNTTDVPVTGALPWNSTRWPTVTFEDAKDSLDVLIELGGQVSAEQTAYIHQRGTRLVSYCCGVEYVNAMQSMLFDRPLWGDGLFINQHYDAVWVIPYPLVHNSEFIKGCGYYYPHFDCQAGGQALLRAFMEHDRRLDDEKRSTAALLHSLDVTNPHNIEVYTRELLALFEPR
jgi:hypothetical protein